MQRDGHMKKVRKSLLAWVLALSLAAGLIAATGISSIASGTSSEETTVSSGTDAPGTTDAAETADASGTADDASATAGVSGTTSVSATADASEAAVSAAAEASGTANAEGTADASELSDASDISSGSSVVTVSSSPADSYILGDVNGDGRVTTADFYLLWNHLSGVEVEINETAADVNGDGRVTTADFYLLWYYLSGVDTGYDIGQEVASGSGIESLTLSDSELNIAAGETAQLSVDITPQDMADTEVTWSSSDEEIATVSADGLVTASSENTGRAVITAQAGELQVQCLVYVGNMVFFYSPQEEIQVAVSDYEDTFDVYAYDGGEASDWAAAYVACLSADEYTYTATADGYYGSTCAFTVAEDGTVSYTTDWAKVDDNDDEDAETILEKYGLDEMLDGSGHAFYLDLEEFVPSSNEGAWDGVTLDVSWFTPGEKEFYISTPEQLAGLAAIVNGIYNDEITRIYDEGRYWSPEDYAEYSGAKIVAGNSSSNGSSGNNNANKVTSDDYYYSALGYDFENATVYLTADLDMGGYIGDDGEWTGARYMPIGGQYQMYYVKKGVADGFSHIGASFNGTFDGQGHIVYNIYCDRYSATAFGDSSSVGLIGRLGNHDNDFETWQTYGDDGGNYPAETPTVRNVAVAGYIYARRSVGGIVGKTGKTAYNYTAYSEFSHVTQGAVIENCVNFATVKNTDAKGCGGIVGAGWNGGIISNCANFGTISSTYKNPTAGISGSNENQIINCYNMGTISAGQDSYAMAIGTNNGGGTGIQNCYWLTGTAPGGGYYNGGSGITVYEVTDSFNDTELTAAEYMASAYLRDDLNGSTSRIWTIASSSDLIQTYLEEAGATGCPVPRIFTEETAEAESITQSGEPTKLSYVAGEYFDTTGLELWASWSDGTSELLDITVDPDRALTEEDTTVKLSATAGELTWEKEYEITVIDLEVESIAVTTQPTQRAYNEGDSFDPTGMKVAITYSNGTTVTAQWQEGTTFVNTTDSSDTYEIAIDVEDPLTYAGSDGGTVTLSYTFVGTTVTCETAALTVIPAASKPDQDSDGCYLVGTADQLDWVAAQVNNGLDTEPCILLTADITANSDFECIGNSSTGRRFAGVLDGGGYTVTLSVSSSGTHCGLIGYASGAVVRNVIVGGTVTGGNYTAALIGYATDTEVSRCGSVAEVTGSSTYTGGLIAYANGSTSVKNCFNRGSVSSTGNSTVVGGIVGDVRSTIVVENCYNRGSVSGKASGTGSGLGGIIGRLYAAATVSNVYNAGLITNSYASTSASTAATYSGSVVGYVYMGMSIYAANLSDYYWLESTGSTYSIGGVKYTTGLVESSELTAELLGSAFVDSEDSLPNLSWESSDE